MQKLANTIIANLGNTSDIGLFKGKTGIALFLYEYAKKLPRASTYEEVADILIDDMYNQINSSTSSDIIDGIAGIGLGASYLLKNKLLEGAPDEVLEDIDRRLLENPRDVLLKEMTSPVPVFSSGLYFLSRFSFGNEEQKERWINHLCDAAIFFVLDTVNIQHMEPPLSFLNSMLFVFNRLSGYCDKNGKSNINQLLHDSLIMIVRAIQHNRFSDIDIQILKELKKTLPAELCEEYDQCLKPLSAINMHTINMEELADELWWYFIYEIDILSTYPKEEIEKYVEQKLLDYSYDIEIINSQFAVLGLLLFDSN